MPMLRRLQSLARTVLRSPGFDRDLDEELRSYVDLLTDEKVRAGVPRDRARREALLEVGGVEQVKDAVRDVRTGAFVDTTLRDLRYGARALARAPAFTSAAVLALALGIGASASVFSVVNAVLLRPLPYREPDRITVILQEGSAPVAPATFIDWRRESTAFEEMAAAELWSPTLSGLDVPEKVHALRVTGEMFTLLGVSPAAGRTFAPSAADAGSEGRGEVVISHRLWQRRFGGSRDVLGRAITLDGGPYVIVGVMPPEFRFAPFWATRAELWAPVPIAERASNRRAASLRVFARLKDGVSLARARAEMATITTRLEERFPGTNRAVTVEPLIEKVVGDVRPALLVLLASVGFVLLIACANVAHMLLARAASRQREMAVRTALGASRSRIVRQLVTESALLALAGGALGAAVAVAAVRALVALGPESIPRVESITLDWRVLVFALAVTLVTGVLFGLAPALQGGARDLTAALRGGDRSSSEGRGRTRVRAVLVASEVALALVLLVGAGLMIRSFRALQAIDPGFEPRNVLTLVVSIAGSREHAPERRAIYFAELIRRIDALPGVESASAINHLPIVGDDWGTRFHVEGAPAPRPGEELGATYRVTLPGYFRTMRIPLRRGRDFTAADRLGAPGVVIVNEELASRHWPGEDPVGKRMVLGRPGADAEWLTVVGVSKNVVRSDWSAEHEPEIYVPYLQDRGYLQRAGSHYAFLSLVIRAACAGEGGCDAGALAPAVRRTVWSLDAGVPISEEQTMADIVRSATAPTRFNLLLLGTFAGVALLLAAVGIYGVMSYAVSRRTREIGIRIALGATRGEVLRMVVWEGVVVAAAGSAAGWVIALALSRLMGSLLYEVTATDPTTFAAVPLILGAVAVAASYVPARRATRVDPLTALRQE